MTNANLKVAILAALALILPFAAGIVHAAETAKPKAMPEKAAPLSSEKLNSPPTIDSDKDGKADAWDRDANGMVDAWDTNGDNKPDRFDDDGDGKPDELKSPPASMGGDEEKQ